MIPKHIVNLTSGGIDSVTLAYHLRAEGHCVHALMVNYRQRHLQELEFAKWHCHKLGLLYTVFEIPELRGSELTDGGGGVVVPNRNAILLSLAVSLAVAAKAETVTFAANKDDAEVFPDCREAFVRAMNAAVKAAGCNVEICGPFLDWTKRQIVERARQLGIPLDQTWSCYRGGVEPCGRCLACQKRKEAGA